MPYFNHRIYARDAATASYWERRAFLNAWWAIYDEDSRWTPPEYRVLRRELNPRHNGHLARLDAILIHVDALHRTGVRRSRTDQQEIPLTSILERPLAAAVAVIDPRRKSNTAHLALPHFSSDQETFDRLYDHLVENLSAQNYGRIIAPVGLSPHLDSGLLVDGWDSWPPLHTPSNPPYAPELVESRLKPLQDGRLYQAIVPSRPATAAPGPATISPLDPARLGGDLLPLLVAATDNPTAAFPAPDAVEAAFLLRLLDPRALTGFLAEVDGAPIGFVLLGPETGARGRATRGGRSRWRRGLFEVETRMIARNRVTAGRLFYGAVLAPWRRRGIGDQLWQHALRHASKQGWGSLTVGPVWQPKGGVSEAANFLAQRATATRATYRLYERSF